MDLNKIFKSKKNIILLIVLGINLTFFILTLLTNDCYFSTVDDSRMRDIASGAMTGEPDGHLIFILYPLGFLISCLYKIFPFIPWYIFFEYLVIYISLCIVLYTILRNANTFFTIILRIILYLFLISIFMKSMIVFPQFTNVSAIAGATSVYIIFIYGDELANSRFFLKVLLISLICFCALYRFKVFLLMIPILIIVLVFKLQKKVLHINILKIICIICVLLSSFKFIDYIAYSTKDYSYYKQYNQIRSLINDYYSLPNYYENIDIYNELNFTFTEYLAASNFSGLLNDNLKIEELKTLVEISKRESTNEKSIKNAFNYFIEQYKSFDTFRWQILLLVILDFFYLIYLIIKKNSIEFLIILALVSMGVFGSLYFCYNLRFPQKIAESLWLPNILIITYALSYRLYPQKDRFITFIQFICLSFFIFQSNLNLQDKIYSTKLNSSGYIYVENLARTNPKNYYFYDVYSFSLATDKFSIEKETMLNPFCSLGGWLTGSPLLDKQFDLYGFTSISDALLNHDNVYIAITNGNTFIIDYLKLKYPDYYPLLIDDGNKYNVQFIKMQKIKEV